MEILNFILTFVFVAFIVILVIGFNKQMMERNKKREEKYKQREKKDE